MGASFSLLIKLLILDLIVQYFFLALLVKSYESCNDSKYYILANNERYLYKNIFITSWHHNGPKCIMQSMLLCIVRETEYLFPEYQGNVTEIHKHAYSLPSVRLLKIIKGLSRYKLTKKLRRIGS